MIEVNWAKTCAFCHVRPRAKWDRLTSFGFCMDADCSAEREVVDAIRRQTQNKSKSRK